MLEKVEKTVAKISFIFLTAILAIRIYDQT
jgi:hypothetical protein